MPSWLEMTSDSTPIIKFEHRFDNMRIFPLSYLLQRLLIMPMFIPVSDQPAQVKIMPRELVDGHGEGRDFFSLVFFYAMIKKRTVHPEILGKERAPIYPFGDTWKAEENDTAARLRTRYCIHTRGQRTISKPLAAIYLSDSPEAAQIDNFLHGQPDFIGSQLGT